MTSGASIPTTIRRHGTHGLCITWSDGHESSYNNDELRTQCPCALCRRRPREALPVVAGQRVPLQPTEIKLIGRYAVNICWSDGHDTGIYSYQTLRALCPCASCRGAAGDN